MNDLISRQEAIDAVETKIKKWNAVDGEGYHGGLGLRLTDVVVTLTELPSAQPEQRWIPVTERLPEPRTDVWCNSDLGQMVGYYEENVETWYGRDYLELMVTAWMPLPEPYREEDPHDH